jgi:hypothetical protein
MPVRHEGDFQRKPIRSWDSWIEEAIREAQERGEFDDLPHAGKKIELEDSPFAPDMASALRTLKNAGYAPTWMEIDREITQGKLEMEQFLERNAAYLQKRQDELVATPTPVEEPPEPHLSLWKRFLRWISFAAEVDPPGAPPRLTLEDLVLIRGRMRDQYLERAAEVDKKTTAFHAALPRNLWHLERLRIPQERAARMFDEAIPPIA